MPCKCKKDFKKKPNEYCLFCAEKHFSTAKQAYYELGYQRTNRQLIIGQLELARKHLSKDEKLQLKIRDLRHRIQDRKVTITESEWDQICLLIDRKINQENGVEDNPKQHGKIYIFSNVEQEQKNRIITNKNDLLVFLNKAVNFPHYKYSLGHKIVFRRSKDNSYGKNLSGITNRFVFDDKRGIDKAFLSKLKQSYDFNYQIEQGKVKCMTTGYMVTQYLHHKFPKHEIILVNFGYQVSNSTYRCNFHNWKFEAEQLKKYKHIYTAKKANLEAGKPIKLFITASGYLGDNLILTAVIHNLIDTGKLSVNIVTAHNTIFENNPYLDKSITPDNADYLLTQNYDSGWRENCKHIIELQTKRIAETINVEIPVKYLIPELYIDTEQPIIKGDYVVINNGFQASAPTKKYYNEYWQKIIDDNKEITFVQIGQKKNHAEPLKGSVSYIDKTNEKQLLNVIKNAKLVISPPSGCIHIAGAYNVPSIVLSGGRQPQSLTKYPNSFYFSSINKFDCCLGKGCHRNKFETDNEAKKCLHCSKLNGEYTADCMLIIKPNQITDKIKEMLTKSEK